MEKDSQKPVNTNSKKRVSSFSTVGIEPAIHSQLTKAAKTLKLSSAAYATAAIAYFTERGLDPTQDRVREGILIQERIDQKTAALGKDIKELGDRLFSFLKTQERTLYDYFVEQESNLFAPIVNELVTGSTDALFARRLGEQVLLKLNNKYNDYPTIHDEQTRKRDELVYQKLQNFIPTRPRIKPTPTPVVTPVQTATPAPPVTTPVSDTY